MPSMLESAVASFRIGGHVRQRGRFVANQLHGAGEARRYELRAGGLPVLLRHGTVDVFTFDEVFHRRLYEPPRPVAEALSRTAAPRVVDLGANIGLFGAWVLSRQAGARIVAYEPDPDNAAMHRELIALSGRGDAWRLVEACAGARAGEVWFRPGLESASHVVGAGADGAIRRAVVDALPDCEGADLVKIDIEGGEWEILQDPRLASARAVVLEHHPDGCPGDDPRATARRLLGERGFDVLPGAEAADGIGMLWGVRSVDVPSDLGG